MKWKPSEERKAWKGAKDTKAESNTQQKQPRADSTPQKTESTKQSVSDTELKKHQSLPKRRHLT